MNKKILQNRPLFSVFISLGIFILVFMVWNTSEMQILNKRLQNAYYSIKNNFTWNEIHKNLFIVEIDDKTLELGQEEKYNLWRFPFDRKAYIPVINNLNAAGASIIGFDIIFVDKTTPESDRLFDETIRNAWNVSIGSFIGKEWKFYPTIFEKSIRSTGFFAPVLDSLNGVVYSIAPFHTFKWWGFLYHFSISLLKTYYSYNVDYTKEKPSKDNKFFYLTPDKKIPLSYMNENNILINFIEYKNFQKNKRTLSFIDVFDSERFQDLVKWIDLKDSIVLIGATATGIKDVFYTPNGLEFWVYTHANIINTILTQNYLTYFNKSYENILLFLLIILSVYFNLSRSWRVLVWSNIALISIFLFIFPFLVILITNLILNNPMSIIFALFVSLVVSNIVKYMMENDNKMRLNQALSEYVSADIAREILYGYWDVNLDGEKKKISIFFSDIEWFTTISEQFTPEYLVLFLREYLSEMSHIILDRKWFINKYEWDAIMALWGVFWEKSFETSSYDACASAIEQQKLLQKLNADWWERGFWTIKARIGIHIGPAIIWNIWAKWRKMEFTALWDSVNLASRLEWVNKHYGTYICVSEDVYNEVKENFHFRYLDTIRVKGKEKSVKIYELCDYANGDNSWFWEIHQQFSQWIDLYLEKQFKEAQEIFKKLSILWDRPSITYSLRCKYFLEQWVTEDWDGIWVMQEK